MTFTKEQKAVLEKAIKHYGVDSQSDIAIEEMSELTKAIIKLRRYKTLPKMCHVCEEIADVLIIIEQLRLAYSSNLINQYITEKIARLEQRIGESSNGKQQKDN